MATHAAIITPAPRAPLQLVQVPTPPTGPGQVRVKNEWVATGPLDLHKADGGLFVTHPEILGGSLAGTVVEVGPDVEDLKVGDKVFAFVYQHQWERAHQVYSVLQHKLLSKVPQGLSLPEAVTIPSNFVTVFHTLSAELGIPLPWPKPATRELITEEPILIWGGSSSVGQYAIQVLRFYGYQNLVAVASAKQHELLKSLGASRVFDYNDPNVVDQLTQIGPITRILDCIGSQNASLAPISKIAQPGATVAIMLPVIIRDASVDEAPLFELDVQKAANWREGVQARGVRTHSYLQNAFFAEHLQPEIMPALIRSGAIRPNRHRVVEGATMLERAEEALGILRRKEVSGERLVWRVSDE